MSQENVEVVRRAYDAFNRRDIASALEVFHSDAEWIPYLAGLEEETYTGRGEIAAMWGEVLRDFSAFRVELLEVLSDLGDTIVIEVSFHGIGRGSGADARTTIFQMASLRDGKVVRVQGFRDRTGALEAAGLLE
jgi:ketosteroid isomerase-like protein